MTDKEAINVAAQRFYEATPGSGDIIYKSVRAWLHSRKGRIVGEVVSQDDTWTNVRLTEDAWADMRRRDFDLAGSVQTYRNELMVEVEYKQDLPPEGDTHAG